jgi:hypothetical protein
VTCGGLQRRRGWGPGWGNCARGGEREGEGGQPREGVRFRRRVGIEKGDRFVRSVYPRVSSCVALITKELGIAMGSRVGPADG